MDEARIAVLDGGLYETAVYRGFNPTFVVPTRAGSLALERFDIVVVPFHVDQVALSHHRQELEGFAKAGGVLIVLGACDMANENWIPFCKWAPDYTKTSIVNKVCPDAEEVFGKFDGKELAFHEKFHAHGVLIPADINPVKVLATGESHRKVALLFDFATGGLALVMTFDPDHHSSPLVGGKGKMTTEDGRVIAEGLLKRIMQFATRRASTKSASANWKHVLADKVFLSHKSTDKGLVGQFKQLLEDIGYKVWYDDEAMLLGDVLIRSIKAGMRESCGAVFFVTPEFKDETWLRSEINYAMEEKRLRGSRFAILTLVFTNRKGERGIVPSLLKEFRYQDVANEMEAVGEIVRALPFGPQIMGWK